MEQKSLMNELMAGKELTEQLINHLQSCSSNETRLFLIEKIISSYEKSLSILNCGAFLDDDKSSSDRKPRSREIFKKRKILPKWNEQVKVCLGTGIEGPINDGYSWRKYGQKDILGANFPRCYYRCTHRHGRGCFATKQVQRSDHDQTIFEITYKGRHTCTQVSQCEVQDKTQKQHAETPKKPDEMCFNYGSNVTVKIEGLQVRENAIADENVLTELDLTEIISAPLSLTNSPFEDFDFLLGNIDFDTNFPYETSTLLY